VAGSMQRWLGLSPFAKQAAAVPSHAVPDRRV
jgi:hypothetical protein